METITQIQTTSNQNVPFRLRVTVLCTHSAISIFRRMNAFFLIVQLKEDNFTQ